MPGEIKPWLEMLDSYSLHKPLYRRFPWNPQSVNKFLDVWEADAVHVQAWY